MSKDTKEYLHYYLGCECANSWFPDTHEMYLNDWKLKAIDLGNPKTYCLSNEKHDTWTESVKPILRKLESMTEGEIIESARLMTVKNIPAGTPMKVFKNDSGHLQISIGDENAGVSLFPLSTFGGNPELFHYLLSRGFWLFGNDWFDEGLIIDKETLTK